jgi:hypothetical protein
VKERAGETFISPSVQRAAIERWAESRGALVGHVFEELDESGGRRDRPLLEEAIARVERGDSQGVVVAYMSRFGRSQLHGLIAIDRITKLYQEERDRLVRVARAAIVAGVEERQVRLAEGQAQQLAEVIRVILTDLGHDLADEHVSEVVSLTVALVAAFSCRGLRGAPSSLPPAPRRNGQHKSPTPAARRLEA